MTAVEKVRALIAAANATTSAGDADLTEAVKSLIEGYGGGGESFWDSEGSVTKTTSAFLGLITVPHNLNASDTDAVMILCLDPAYPLRYIFQIGSPSKVYYNGSTYALTDNILNENSSTSTDHVVSTSFSTDTGNDNITLYWQSGNSCSLCRTSHGTFAQGTYKWYAKKITITG